MYNFQIYNLFSHCHTEMVKQCKSKDSIFKSIYGLKATSDSILKEIPDCMLLSEKTDLTNHIVSYTDKYEISDINKLLRKYFVSQTMQDYSSFVPTESFKINKKHEKTLCELYSSSPEGYVEYFIEKQKECKSIIDDYILELKRWEVEILAYTTHNPKVEDYNEKLKELYTEIKLLDNKIPIERYFAKGPDDCMLAGSYLVTLVHKRNKRIIKEFVRLFSGIQWLIRKRVEKKVNEPEVAEIEIKQLSQIYTLQDAIEILLTKYLKLKSAGRNVDIGGKSWNATRLMITVREVLKERKTFPFRDEKEYADFIASCIGKKPDNVRKNINHQYQTVKVYDIGLKELTEEYIKRNVSKVENGMTARQFRIAWKGIYELVDNFIDQMDDLTLLRTNSAQTPLLLRINSALH